MADKTYYWLKMNKDFMKRHDIRIMKRQPNGAEMVAFYIALLLESIDHNGELKYSAEIPYSIEELAIITDTDLEVAEQAMKYLEEKDLIQIMQDGAIWLTEATKMIGKESDSAERKRNQRARENEVEKSAKTLENTECHADVTPMSQNVTEQSQKSHIEIEIEKEIDIYNTTTTIGDGDDSETLPELDNDSIEWIVGVWNSSSVTQNIKGIKLLSKRYDNTRLCIQKDIVGFLGVISELEQQAFFQEQAKKNKRISYDWFIEPDNYQKVIEGNYKDKFEKDKPPNKFSNFDERSYDYDELEDKLFNKGG